MKNQELKHKLKEDGYIYLKVFGGSMRPWIKSGSVLKINTIETAIIRRGDIVLYQVEGQFLVHRVIKINKSGKHIFSGAKAPSTKIFVIAGDNRIDTIFHKISEEQIIGIVEHSSRIKRLIELFLVMPIHFIYVFARFIRLNKKSPSTHLSDGYPAL